MSSQNELNPDRKPLPARSRSPRSWSLHWQLLASHLLLVSLVVLGFGGAIYGLVRQTTYRQAEADLLGAAHLLVQDLKDHGDSQQVTIAQVYRHRFGPAPRDHAYFVVWDYKGKKMMESDLLPPQVQRPGVLPPTDGPRPYLTQTHGTHLDVVIRGPALTTVLIGRPLAKEFDSLQRLAVTVCLFGCVSLVAGGCGAWWLAKKLAAPIARMAETAEQISVKNLAQRLDPETSSTEVNRLTSVFNSMLDRLQAAFQRQSRFTADASHELRTPVSVILSQAEHSLNRVRTSEEYQAALQTCLRASRRMKHLVEDLLLLARADSGRMELRLEPLDLADIVRQSLALLTSLADENQLQLISQLQSTPIQGDSTKLGQVITNLVTNALQYNREAGQIFVHVSLRGMKAVLMVADTGIGIPFKDQPHLFERFYRADTVRTHREGQGTGLGLSIVSEIVAAHAGTINITSEPEVGTTVTVEMPARTVCP